MTAAQSYWSPYHSQQQQHQHQHQQPSRSYSSVATATTKDTKTNTVLVKSSKPSLFVHCPTPKPAPKAYFITLPTSVLSPVHKSGTTTSPSAKKAGGGGSSSVISEFEHSQNQLNLFRLGGIYSLDSVPLRKSMKACNTMLPYESRVHDTKGSVGSRLQPKRSQKIFSSIPFTPSSSSSSSVAATAFMPFESVITTQLRIGFQFPKRKVEHSVLESPKLKRSKLFVFCFISSRYMRYPNGNDDERVVFELIPTANEEYQTTVVFHTVRTIPTNTFLHLELQVQTDDDNRTHHTLVPVGRAVVDYRSLLPEAAKYGFQPSNTTAIEVHDVYNFMRVVGFFNVSFETGGRKEMPTFSIAMEPIVRTLPSERHRVYGDYMGFIYKESWGRFRSNVKYPDGTKVPNPYMNEFAETIDGILPVALYVYQASIGNIDTKTQNDFVDTLIRMACVIRRLSVDEVRNWNTLDTKDLWKIWRLLPVVVTCFPRALSYTYDVLKRGSPYNFPMHSDGLEHAAMVCVEHSTLCATIVQALRTATSSLAKKFHPLVNGYYRGCFMHCTVRTGDLDGKNSVVCKHMVYALMPRKVMDSLAVNREGTPIHMSDSSSSPSAPKLNVIGFPPLFLETMENICYTVPSSPDGDINMPGCLTPHEPEFLGGMLPAYYSSDIAFYGDHPYYGDVMTIYPVDGSNSSNSPIGDIICLKRDTSSSSLSSSKAFTDVMVIGIPLRELLQMTPTNLNTNSILGHYALYMPKELDQQSVEVKIAMESAEETRFLRTVWCNPRKINFTDEMVQKLTSKIPDRGDITGWRVSYSFFREDEVRERFQSRLQSDVKDSNERLRNNINKNLPFSHVTATELSNQLYVEGSIYIRAILTTYDPTHSNSNATATSAAAASKPNNNNKYSYYDDGGDNNNNNEADEEAI